MTVVVPYDTVGFNFFTITANVAVKEATIHKFTFIIDNRLDITAEIRNTIAYPA